MKIARTINEITEIRQNIDDEVAFVPTMGALHEGHMSLIKKASENGRKVIVSIFVNPTQFGEGEDFEKYPRTEEADLEKCKSLSVEAVFLPSPEEIYPKSAVISMKVNEKAHILCGKSRPIHFDGVVQVVSILFNIVRPDVAVFGKKDYQQLSIIRDLVSDFHYPIEIIGAETVRENSGLAKSSRNRYLSEDGRAKATGIFKTINAMITKTSEVIDERMAMPTEFMEHTAKEMLLSFIPEAEIDYIEIRNTFTLEKDRFINDESHIFFAVKVEGTRLIDNMRLA